jgi:hypothetical protein
MNTCVWGPPLWRILHGVAYHVPVGDAAAARAVAAFMDVLAYALPCKYCRASFVDFCAELAVELGPPNRCALQGCLQQWVWALHNKVSRKLLLQKCDAIGLRDAAMREALADVMQVSFEALQKSLRACPEYFCAHDVLKVLGALVGNADDDVAPATEVLRRAQHAVDFMRALDAVLAVSLPGPLREHMGIPACIACPRLPRLPRRAARAVLYLYEHLSRTFGGDGSEADVRELRARARAGKSTACAHGACV